MNFICFTYRSRRASSLNGNPVPTKASFRLAHLVTRMRRSSRKAPLPLEAVNSSFFDGS